MPGKPTKNPLKRQLNVNKALASARIEGFTPSKELLRDLLDFVEGHRNISELINEAKGRHKTKLKVYQSKFNDSLSS